MKFGVIVFPGSNCDLDAYYLVKDVLREPVGYIWHEETGVDGYDALILPGGFSYGDYLRSGAIARFAPVMAAVADFAQRGGLVLGICNGFQVLTEAGLLPGALYRNAHLQFRCRQIYARVENNQLPFTGAARPGQVLRLPIAHGDGNYFAGPELLPRLKANNQVVFRYVEQDGRVSAAANPNGSEDNIAGVCNAAGNVLGLMPHPERAGEALLGSADGLVVFRSMLEFFKARGGVRR
ncbi:MAG: phosphoribosylformylglycinamidine synthase subunit PurQ [Bacillota bacterium]